MKFYLKKKYEILPTSLLFKRLIKKNPRENPRAFLKSTRKFLINPREIKNEKKKPDRYLKK